MEPVETPRSFTLAELQHGIDLFNRGDYFAAHEVWEDAWRTADGDERRFLQGLIQCAVALEHARRGNRRGAQRLALRYSARLDTLPCCFMGVNVADLLVQMRRFTEAIAAAPDATEQSGMLERCFKVTIT